VLKTPFQVRHGIRCNSIVAAAAAVVVGTQLQLPTETTARQYGHAPLLALTAAVVSLSSRYVLGRFEIAAKRLSLTKGRLCPSHLMAPPLLPHSAADNRP
jgi:hypothetical protein